MTETSVTQSADRTRDPEPAIVPFVDVVEGEAGITLYADLPGVPKDRLHVHVDSETLLIEGEIVTATPATVAATHAEVQVPRYRRRFSLSRELDANKVDASFNNGVLRLHIPKAEHAQSRRIEVKVS